MTILTDILIWAVMAAILLPFWSYIAFIVWAIVTGKAFQGSSLVMRIGR